MQIDWQTVADEVGITNGHAARMRFSRFKQQMEGNYPTRRHPRESEGANAGVEGEAKPKTKRAATKASGNDGPAEKKQKRKKKGKREDPDTEEDNDAEMGCGHAAFEESELGIKAESEGEGAMQETRYPFVKTEPLEHEGAWMGIPETSAGFEAECYEGFVKLEAD